MDTLNLAIVALFIIIVIAGIDYVTASGVITIPRDLLP